MEDISLNSKDISAFRQAEVNIDQGFEKYDLDI